MVSANQIRHYPIFEGLDEAELTRLANVMTRRVFAKGAYVFMPGRPAGPAYLVESGLVRLFFSTTDGGEVLFNLAGPSESLMFPTPIDDQLRWVGAAAVQPTVLLTFEREDFFQMFNSSAQFARNVYQAMVVYTRKLLLLTRTLTSLNLNGRLATVLLRMAIRNEKYEDAFYLPVSQEELAGWIGSSRGRLNKAMKLLEQLGMIRVEGRTIVILDHPGLVRMSEEQTLEKM